MNKTKIDWCDYTWNPITGCLHGCPYCYARRMVQRFSTVTAEPDGNVHDLKKPGKTIYPFGFDPTFHRYRLDEPQRVKKPSTIFVCSMADLFGDWVPDEWIKAVFEATNKAPWHRYIYLTKNPDRYYQIGDGEDSIIPDGGVSGLFGASATTAEQAWSVHESAVCSWLSIEPLHGEFTEELFWYTALVGDGVFDEIPRWQWIVIGAETGGRKGKVIPKRQWIEGIANFCREAKTPLFMKNSLAEIWGEPLIQEYPWEATP